MATLLLSAQPAPDAPVRLEPVSVEARLLTDSPATVTSVELADLPAAEMTTAGLAARTANFFVASNDAHSFNDTFALRGLTNTPIFGDPAVSFYLDDLPLGSGFTFPVDLAGFARADLHRGPTQNTVFGRAGSAGVVTLATPEPGAEPAGEVRASYGSYAAREVVAAGSSAAGGPVDAYVSAGYAARDGYITNTTLNQRVDDKESSSALARLRLRPAGPVELTLLVTGLRARDGAQPLVPLGGPYFTVERSHEGETDLDAWNAALTAAITLPIGRLTATTSYNDWNLGPYLNTLSFGFADLTDGVTQHQRAWNEEIRLSSDPKSPVRWAGGLFLSDGKTDGAFDRTFGPFPYEKSEFQITARDLAAFGEATWRVTPAVSLTAGARAEDSRKEMARQEQVPVLQDFNLTRDSSVLLPKVGLDYTRGHDTDWFVSAGAGFKPGGFSAFTGNPALATFGPERTRTLEAGVTRTNAAKTAMATARFFYYDISGYQIERSFDTGGGGNDYLVVNAARARSLGGELELSWKATPELTLALDAGATDVTLRKFTDPFTGQSFAGNRAPAVPVYDLSVRADYALEAGFFAGVELSANGRTYYTESEDLAFGQRAYALLDAHLGYARGRYRVTLYGENLADARYYSAITPGTGHGTPGAPRTYGIELRAKL